MSPASITSASWSRFTHATPHEKGNDRAIFTRLTIPAGLALAASALATLYLGILPGRVVHLTQRSAATLIDSADPAPAPPTTATR